MESSNKQQPKKEPFGQAVKKQSWQQLQQLNYIKVKVVFHKQDKSLKTVVYKCSAKETMVRFINALKLSLKLNQHQAIFIYHNRRVVDQKKPLGELRGPEQSDIIVLDAATSDIF